MPGNVWDIKPDMECDISKPLPFPDEHAHEIHSYHLIEHFYRYEIVAILADWRRVLKTGGVLVIECPNLEKIGRLLEKNRAEERNVAMLGLYGTQKHGTPEMVHKWCYSPRELETILRGIGFEEIRRMEPKTHRLDRDLRIEAVK